MTLCYYVTGHGYGHAIRTAQILKALPVKLPVILRTVVPERLFAEEVPGRAFTYAPAEFDCGCLQSDSVTVLPRATLDRYAELAAQNSARLSDEVVFLRQNHIRAVVTDIPSFPLRAAHEAGIPGYAVANFTWHDIYKEYAETAADNALLAEMEREYGLATRAFLTPLATPTVAAPFSHIQRVPLVARQGRNIRARLTAETNLALLYLGPWGMDVDWSRVGEIDGWTFLTYDPPAQPQPNIFILDRATWPYADVAASVDVVISKAGYGTVTECIANGVPLIYIPRTAFAEYEALVSGMTRWGGGIPLSETAFRAGHWLDVLQLAVQTSIKADAYAVNGAQIIADQFAAIL